LRASSARPWGSGVYVEPGYSGRVVTLDLANGPGWQTRVNAILRERFAL
jgi:hypothetical protein